MKKKLKKDWYFITIAIFSFIFAAILDWPLLILLGWTMIIAEILYVLIKIW